MMDKKESYFEAALSDFMFDVAAGGAIRHLVDRGYSVEQIMKRLDYPVPRPKVEKAVYRHLTESGILLHELPKEDEKIKIHMVQEKNKEKLPGILAEHIDKYGEQNSYMECPFGQWMKTDEKKLQQVMASLSAREREYILGIRWEYPVMYHRLNSRMREIGIKLAGSAEGEWRFYFWE